MSRFYQRERIPEDRPTTIRVTPILPADQQADELAVFETVAEILQTEARQIAGRILSDQIVTTNIPNTASGYLQMTNIENNQHAHVEDLLISDLDVFALLDLFDRVRAESNPNLTVYSVRWEFWVNPSSVILGGARLASSKDGTCIVSNKIYEYNQIRAGCAAVCCAIHLIKTFPQYATLKHNLNRPTSHKKIYDIAINIQNELRNPNINNRMVC
jgi:hypothetical protein